MNHIATVLLGILLAGWLLEMPAAASRPPNLLFLFTDDQRHDALGASGNTVIQTPELDALAEQGVRFRNCFVTTSICAVSRASVLSGQYARRHGIQDFFKTFTPEQLDQTYPALLRKAGYTTGFIGKWGIGDSLSATDQGARAFDFWAGASHQTCFWHERTCPYVTDSGTGDPQANRCTCPPDSRGKQGPHNRIGKANLQDPVHLTTEIVPRKVEQFLAFRDPDRPFCLSIFFKAPHAPMQDFDPRFQDQYQGVTIPPPVTATREDIARRPACLNGKLGTPTGRKWVEHPEALQAHYRDYYRLISGIDLAVGKIRAQLEQQDLADQTVILFTSDNGHFKGEFGLSGKWLMYDPSQRVPGFIMDPRLPEAVRGTRDQLVLHIDFTATMLDLAGLPVPHRMQGRSLVPLLQGGSPDWRQDIFYEHAYHHRGAITPTEGVRTTSMKYTRYVAENPVYEELFDLQRDPHERHNLVADPAFGESLNQLRNRWTYYVDALQ